MNEILNKLSDIEQYATSIMDDANASKKAIMKEMEEKTAAFDAQLDAETAQKLETLRKQMEAETQAELSRQENAADIIRKGMKASYETHHTAYARQLFAAMTER